MSVELPTHVFSKLAGFKVTGIKVKDGYIIWAMPSSYGIYLTRFDYLSEYDISIRYAKDLFSILKVLPKKIDSVSFLLDPEKDIIELRAEFNKNVIQYFYILDVNTNLDHMIKPMIKNYLGDCKNKFADKLLFSLRVDDKTELTEITKPLKTLDSSFSVMIKDSRVKLVTKSETNTSQFGLILNDDKVDVYTDTFKSEALSYPLWDTNHITYPAEFLFIKTGLYVINCNNEYNLLYLGRGGD